MLSKFRINTHEHNSDAAPKVVQDGQSDLGPSDWGLDPLELNSLLGYLWEEEQPLSYLKTKSQMLVGNLPASGAQCVFAGASWHQAGNSSEDPLARTQGL